MFHVEHLSSVSEANEQRNIKNILYDTTTSKRIIPYNSGFS